MRADRLIGMLMLLQTRRRLTAAHLADEFAVSPRTVLRDVEALRDAGVPIATVRGPRGGIELREGFRTDLTGLNDEEARVLLLAGTPAVAHALGLGDAADAARRKLAQALAPEHRALARGLGTWLRLEFPAPADPGPDRRRVPRLVRAIRERRLVRLAVAGDVARTVRPALLAVAPGGWRLETHDGEAIRLADIRDMRLLGQTFEAPAPGPPQGSPTSTS